MKKAPIFVGLLAVLVVASGCVSNSSVPAVAPLSNEAGTNAYADAEQIRSQLQIATASGGMSPEAYGEINNKINSLESSGYDTRELRQMLSQLAVGGQQHNENALPQQTQQIQQISSMPVLKNLGVNFDRWDPVTNRAGDFLFMQGTFDEHILVPFGYLVENENGAKRLPEITYILPVGTPVVSPIDGIVFNINVIGWSQDYAVHLKTSRDEEWMVSFEHLINLNVAMGDRINAGQIIGEAAPWNGGTGFAELVVWKGGREILKRCPFDALEESIKPVYAEKISNLVSDWEK